MAEFTYASGSGNGVRHFPDDEGLHPNFARARANSLEFLVQQHIIQDLHSPTMQNHTPAPSTSQNQAESQPYAIAHMTSRTGNGYSQRPVNMTRSASQYSSTSSSQYQRNGTQQRASRGSFGNASSPNAIGMTGAASPYSSASTIQAAPQPNATQPHLDTTNYYHSTLPPLSSPANPHYGAISATVINDPILDFDVSEFMGRHSAEVGQEHGVFGHTTTSNE